MGVGDQRNLLIPYNGTKENKSKNRLFLKIFLKVGIILYSNKSKKACV